jgi:hypothetical protein
MPADRDDAACTVAGVRKRSMNETAGNGRRQCRGRYGDLGAAKLGHRTVLRLSRLDQTVAHPTRSQPQILVTELR